jgi:mRNA interferase RelE/StbE
VVYAIRYLPEARHKLRRLLPEVRRQLVIALWALAAEPRPRGSFALPGEAAELVADRRAWAGSDYRVVYDVYDGDGLIVVVRLSHRAEAAMAVE